VRRRIGAAASLERLWRPTAYRRVA